MRTATLFWGFFLFLKVNCFCQNKPNPIVYAEMFGGYSAGSSSGWTGGIDLNYQIKDNLFTARYLGLVQLKHDTNFLIFPIYIDVDNINEIALLLWKKTYLWKSCF